MGFVIKGYISWLLPVKNLIILNLPVCTYRFNYQ